MAAVKIGFELRGADQIVDEPASVGTPAQPQKMLCGPVPSLQIAAGIGHHHPVLHGVGGLLDAVDLRQQPVLGPQVAFVQAVQSIEQITLEPGAGGNVFTCPRAAQPPVQLAGLDQVPDQMQ